MSSAVEASVDSFFGESPEVERASRTSQSLSSSSSTASLSDTETESSNGASTARSSSSQDSVEVAPQEPDDNTKVDMSEETKEPEPEPVPPVRASMESEGELTDVSPMVTPRPSDPVVGDSIDVKDSADFKEPVHAYEILGEILSEDNRENTDSKQETLDVKQILNDPALNDELAQGDIQVSVTRPKSAHPSRQRGRKASTTSSVNTSISSRDFELDSARNDSDIRKHRDRLLCSTSKNTKDLNHLLEAVLVLDQKMADRDQAKDPNPFPPRAVGGSRASSARGSRKSSFTTERQREIQKENERLLRELTKQKSRRPMSAVSATSIRSTASSRSQMSGISAASAIEFRKSANCRQSPIARNYHSRINRTKEAKRIDEENLALLRRLQNVRASPAIQMSRQQVARPSSSRPRTKSARPKIVNTWTDGW